MTILPPVSKRLRRRNIPFQAPLIRTTRLRRKALTSLEWFQQLPYTERLQHRLHNLFPAQNTRRNATVTADPEIAPLFTRGKRGKRKAGYVVEMSGGRYLGQGYGYVITPGDQVLLDASPSPSQFWLAAPGNRHRQCPRYFGLPPITEIPGSVAIIHTLFSDHFFHFLLDMLPKFGLLEKAGWQHPEIAYFVLGPMTAPFQRETLARLGIPPSKIITSHSGVHLRARRLLVPAHTEPGRRPELYDYSPQGLEYVRRIFLADNPALTRDWPDKILVSHAKPGNRRRIANTEALNAALDKLGFATVFLENYTLAEQAAIFHHARIVITAAGSHSANYVFCRPGTRVIELFHPASLVPTFSLPLASALGLDYYAMLGEPAKTGAAHDIAVCVPRLLASQALHRPQRQVEHVI